MDNKKSYTAKYTDPDELYLKVQEYFFNYIHGEKAKRVIEINGEKVEEEYYVRYPEPATITGLCLFLGFASRQSFYDLGKMPKFKEVIEYASLCVQNKYEVSGLVAKNPTFQIFVLKNMGWEDTLNQVIKADVKTEGKVDISKLSLEEKKQLRDLQKKIKGNDGTGNTDNR